MEEKIHEWFAVDTHPEYKKDINEIRNWYFEIMSDTINLIKKRHGIKSTHTR